MQRTTIVGEHTGLTQTFTQVAAVVGSDAPVLLLGETGTGKEVVARAIHERSLRRDGPFLRVNCGAIAPELIDAELFGHERGAFTGAHQARKGWFEQADGGTLFLDEIAELAAAAQVRLLRVIQEHELIRVGGDRILRIDVRIVAATHRDLRTEVQQGRFREDLYYRVAVFPIQLPPLRERRGDFEELAMHFCRRSSQRFGMRFVAPTPADVARLQEYQWPGNIREFASVIDRAVLLGGGDELAISAALGQGSSHAPPALADDLELSLDEVCRRHIIKVLQASHGRVEGPFGAARRLGLNPHTLRGRMRKLGIDWSSFKTP